jgi:formyltetrahydrofolate-dependent phosphoribosylglycinamide formyltransferase
MSVRVAVFASGGGSNLQALIDAFNGADDAPARVALVISDREAAPALGRARAAGVPAHVVPVRARAAAEVGAETLALLEEHAVGLIALAGYLRLLPDAVVQKYPGRIVNIHPALLPSFGGAGMYGRRVHEAVLASGARVSGPTVHFVNERYDEGAIIGQWPVPVLPNDTPETLAARVLAVEHRLYPLVIAALALGSHGGVPLETAAFHLDDDVAPGAAELLRLIHIPTTD